MIDSGSPRSWQQLAAQPPSLPVVPRTLSGLRSRSPASLADYLIDLMRRHIGADIVYTAGGFYAYDRGAGVWRQLEDAKIDRMVKSIDGAKFGKKDQEEMVTMGVQAIEGTVKCMGIELRDDRFFDDPRPGIAFVDKFVVLDEATGTYYAVDHSPDHRCRWPVACSFEEVKSADLRGSRLERFIGGLLPGDPERDAKLNAIFEAFGAVACNLAVRVAEPKAFGLIGKSNSGKTSTQILCAALVPSWAISHVSPGELTEQNRALLVGSRLNIASEASAKALAAEHFKLMVRGEPMRAKTVYRKPFFFRPQCLTVVNYNRMPEWGDKVDSGVANRLQIIDFGDHPVRNAEIGIAEAIVEHELPLLFNQALTGASRLVRQGRRYTEIAGGAELVEQWRIEGEPIEAWVREQVKMDPCGRMLPRAAVLCLQMVGGVALWVESVVSGDRGELRQETAADPNRVFENRSVGRDAREYILPCAALSRVVATMTTGELKNGSAKNADPPSRGGRRGGATMPQTRRFSRLRGSSGSTEKGYGFLLPSSLLRRLDHILLPCCHAPAESRISAGFSRWR